ncbi:PREDICTED: uncharacterized protein C6orf132 homolog [Chrysochloris asiatica]|uniref:Uncharacterized protein C6orf132 homolog n=1 Tax=Chrysochloris asiatica TaxID=185453 RepID=A0A9B0WMX0_CHRAS|nr:PREDICTED: uncharacterized protein C6orf132 homolog [Chrysochloris asiatica]
MKKNQTVQGTFSKLFGKKHASPTTTSLYATNPPWIFTQEAPEEGSRDFDGIYYGDNRFDTVSESGTATLKARPRVRPLLTFLPLNAQENHGLAVPTPSVPEDFAGKELTGTSSLVNGNLRLYSSVGDLRQGHYGQDPPIPPPPPGPAPGPPSDTFQPPPPPSTAPPPPPLLLEPPPPPNMAPPPPPVFGALSPPSTPTPPDFIPPAPPSILLAPPPPPLPAPAPPAPVSSHTSSGSQLFRPGGVTKWKSEVALNDRQPAAPTSSPPRSPAKPKGSPLVPKSESHLTFPRSFKVPPPTPVRTSSIQAQEAQVDPPEEEGATKKVPSRLPLPPSFHIRPVSQAYPDREPEPGSPGTLRAAAPASPRLGQAQLQTNEHAETPPPAPLLPPPAPPLLPEAPLLPPPAPPLPPPATPLPPPAPPLPSAEKVSPPLAGYAKSSKSSSSVPKPKPPSPDDTASPAPVDWRDPSQMEKLRSELAAYLCGSKRDNRSLGHRPGPTVASQDKKGPKKAAPPSLPEKETPRSLPEKETPPVVPEKKSPRSNRVPEKETTTSLILPPVDYIPQDSLPPNVRQIREKLEARFSSSAEKEAKPSLGSLPPKPLPEGGRIFENGAGNGKFSKPVTKILPPVSVTPLPTRPLQSKPTSGPATPPKATSGPTIPSTATTLPVTLQLMAEKDTAPAGQWETPVESQELVVPSQPEANGSPLKPSKLPAKEVPSSPALPPKTSTQEEIYLYKPHRSQNSCREVAVVMPNLARGEAAGSGESVEVKEPQGLQAKTPVRAPPADELLRHPVTGEVVERGSPMALLLAARQRAQKGRSGGAPLGRSSLPGSLRGHSNPPEAGSDSIFYSEGLPNSFTVVPKLSKETKKDSMLDSSTQPTVPSQWTPQLCRNSEGTEPSRWHKRTKAEPQAPAAWEKPVPSKPPQGRPQPKSFSSPSSPSYKREEFNFEVIPPPPEFSNDRDLSAPTLQYPGQRGSSPRNNFSDLRESLDMGPSVSQARGYSRFPTGARYSGAGGLERFSAGGRSLIKKRLYVGDAHHSRVLARGGTGRSMSSPNCFGPQLGGPFGTSGGPEMRRVNSVGRAHPGGLHTRRMSMEGTRSTPYTSGGGTAEAKYKAASGDYGFGPSVGRSPHNVPHYGSSPVNTFTVRPGTRHPISYAYSGAHRKATS